VPQGGAALSVILDACIQFQRKTSATQTDVAYVSANYLTANSANLSTEVHIKVASTLPSVVMPIFSSSDRS
jgi:hypothetical protein